MNGRRDCDDRSLTNPKDDRVVQERMARPFLCYMVDSYA